MCIECLALCRRGSSLFQSVEGFPDGLDEGDPRAHEHQHQQRKQFRPHLGRILIGRRQLDFYFYVFIFLIFILKSSFHSTFGRRKSGKCRFPLIRSTSTGVTRSEWTVVRLLPRPRRRRRRLRHNTHLETQSDANDARTDAKIMHMFIYSFAWHIQFLALSFSLSRTHAHIYARALSLSLSLKPTNSLSHTASGRSTRYL